MDFGLRNPGRDMVFSRSKMVWTAEKVLTMKAGFLYLSKLDTSENAFLSQGSDENSQNKEFIDPLTRR